MSAVTISTRGPPRAAFVVGAGGRAGAVGVTVPAFVPSPPSKSVSFAPATTPLQRRAVGGTANIKRATLAELEKYSSSSSTFETVVFECCDLTARDGMAKWVHPKQTKHWSFKQCVFPIDRLGHHTLAPFDLRDAESVRFVNCNLVGLDVSALASIGRVRFDACALGADACNQFRSIEARREPGAWVAANCI